MGTYTPSDFARSIYQEHLEEAAFLYEQRRFLLDDETLDWRDLGSFEDRLNAHLDGLVLGSDLALEVIISSLQGADDGGLYAGVRVLCQLDRSDILRGLLKNLEPDNAGKVQAWADALAEEMPALDYKPWLEKIAPELGRTLPVAVKLAGLRRLATTASLHGLLRLDDPPDPAELIWAAGRTCNRDVDEDLLVPVLYGFLDHLDEKVRFSAAFALLRMGHAQTVAAVRISARNSSWPLISLGLCGGRSDARLLIKIAGTGHTSPECLTAIGWLGSILAVDTLLAHLDSPLSAPAAAFALEMITGADLKEEVFISEPPDPAEFFDDELELLQNGQPPHPPGHEPGTAVTRTRMDKQTWQDWWQQNKSNFYSDTRYRFGRPVTPEGLLEDIIYAKLPRRHRQLAIEELAIRYDIDLGFETEMFVARQKRAIDHWMDRVGAGKAPFEPGLWYFAGAIQAQV